MAELYEARQSGLLVPPDVVRAKGAPDTRSEVTRYLNCISGYDREFKNWQGRVDKILKRYRDEKRNGAQASTARFNILWSNVQTLIPATFSRLPQPDVSRRFRDNDPVGRVAAMIVERALDYEVQHYSDYQTTLTECLRDRFLGGRGTCWVRYEPHIKRVEGQGAETPETDGEGTESADGDSLPEAGLQVTEDSSATSEELEYECAPVDYVHWKDFGHSVARTWEEVTAVWRAVYMTRQALVERFGSEKGDRIPLDSKPENLTREQMASEGEYSRAKIYELWDITDKCAYWFSKSMPEMLDVRDDPLELEDFWPCPKPLFSTLTNESLIPVPDFTIYQDQQNTLDTLANRIDKLVQALKVSGVYDASQGTALARLFTESDDSSTLIPVKNWAAFAEKNGLQGAIDIVDLTPIANALRESYAAMEQVKNQVYELTGISDIIRGQGEASETATAQQLKGQYASLRLKSYQEEVARFATEILRLKAQVICGKFDPQTIGMMASVDQLSEEDKAVLPQAMQLLTNGPLRSFRIGIAADTLVQMDEQAEKQSRTEFLTATSGFMQHAMPMVEAAAAQGAAPLVGLIFELLKFGVTGYPVGKTIEGKFDEALDQLQKKLAQPKPPQQNPEVMKIQAQQQAEQMKMQQAAQEHAGEMQMRTQEQQIQAQIEQHRNELEAQREQQKAALNAQLEQFKAEQQRMIESEKTASAERIAHLDSQTKIAIAEMQGQMQLKTTTISANAAKNKDGESVTEVGADGAEKPTGAMESLVQVLQKSNEDFLKTHQDGMKQILEAVSRPKTFKGRKGPDGAWQASLN